MQRNHRSTTRTRARAQTLASLAACLLSIPFAQSLAQGGGKIADCRIESAGKVDFNGKCRFTPDGASGSFSLSRDGQGALYGTILAVTVVVVSPGVAEVRGLTRDGINSRWGEAKRSAQEPACWLGSDFKVCAR